MTDIEVARLILKFIIWFGTFVLGYVEGRKDMRKEMKDGGQQKAAP